MVTWSRQPPRCSPTPGCRLLRSRRRRAPCVSTRCANARFIKAQHTPAARSSCHRSRRRMAPGPQKTTKVAGITQRGPLRRPPESWKMMPPLDSHPRRPPPPPWSTSPLDPSLSHTHRRSLLSLLLPLLLMAGSGAAPPPPGGATRGSTDAILPPSAENRTWSNGTFAKKHRERAIELTRVLRLFRRPLRHPKASLVHNYVLVMHHHQGSAFAPLHSSDPPTRLPYTPTSTSTSTPSPFLAALPTPSPNPPSRRASLNS